LHKEATNGEHEVCDYTDNIWVTGMLTKALKKNLEAIPERHSIDFLQKTVAYVWKTHTVRKVLQSENLSLSGGDQCCCRGEGPRRKRLRQETTTTTTI